MALLHGLFFILLDISRQPIYQTFHLTLLRGKGNAEITNQQAPENQALLITNVREGSTKTRLPIPSLPSSIR